ncbi:jg22723, partial [Pararge aegeria aegeria]
IYLAAVGGLSARVAALRDHELGVAGRGEGVAREWRRWGGGYGTYRALPEYALKPIKWDIIGLSEIRRLEEKIEEYEDYIFYYKNEIAGFYGVGFLMRKHLQNDIQEFFGITDRIAVLNINLPCNKHPISIVQICAPTENTNEETKDTFYNQLNLTMRTVYNSAIVMGDFNGQIGKIMNSERKLVGPHSSEKRGLIDFAHEHNLCVMNTFYKKKANRKWTWISPNGNVRN